MQTQGLMMPSPVTLYHTTVHQKRAPALTPTLGHGSKEARARSTQPWPARPTYGAGAAGSRELAPTSGAILLPARSPKRQFYQKKLSQ